jgi:hypothetical protein
MLRALRQPRPTSGPAGPPKPVPGRRALPALFLITLLLGCGVSGQAAGVVDPALRFRTLTTEHFVIHFHPGEEHLAVRLTRIAEDVRCTVAHTLDLRAPDRIHVILTNQTDIANGWAALIPRDTIFMPAAPPAGSEFLGYEQDWLRLLFTHELAHIVHLDQSERWTRLLRLLLGRTPIAFPNLSLPGWQVEGLASWMESRLTGQGRLHAGNFRAIEHEAARAGGIEPLDRVSGGLIDWPGGLATYAFGLGFHEYLAKRFGDPSIARLVGETSRRLPLLGLRAYSTVFGESVSALWRDYQEAGRDEALRTHADVTADAQQITRQGFYVTGPRFASGACPGCPDEVVYASRDPHAFPALRAVTLPSSGHPPASRRLASRYLGRTTAVTAHFLVFDQQELRRNVASYADLYVMDRRTGQVAALTRDARLQDPDISPDGRSIVAVRSGAGARDLVRLQLAVPIDAAPSVEAVRVSEPTVIASGIDMRFDAPRWSPDGASIAVVRHRLGANSEIVSVDAATGRVRVLASSPDGRFVTPAWRPDGQAVVAAAAFGDDVFDLYELDVADASGNPRRLTDVDGGALWPDISADGRQLVYVGYTARGFDLFVMSYPAHPVPVDVESGKGPLTDDPAGQASLLPSVTDGRSVIDESTPYQPLRTLAPTSWFPVIESDGFQVRAGAATSGADVLGRHAYFGSATWLLSRSRGSSDVGRTSPDWEIAYAYDRWRPTVFVSASSDTLFAAGPPDAAGHPANETIRTNQFEAGVVLPIRHVRVSHRVAASVIRTSDRAVGAPDDRLGARTALRVGAATNSSHLFGYSISPERGIAAGVTAEFVRPPSGSSNRATTVTGDLRAYVPGMGEHQVIALRLAGGVSSGSPGQQRTFLLGGPGSHADVLDFGRGAFSLLRGFPAHSFAGTRVATANAEYRWPIARPQRGPGAWPIFLRTLHGAVFADAGHAWTGRFDSRDAKTSVGAELAVDAVAAYSVPFTTAIGGAWGYDGARHRRGTTMYVRIGGSF